MGYLLGIDVGTTRTAAATGRADAGLGDFEIVNLGDRASSVPSVLYLGEDGSVLVGDGRRTPGHHRPGPRGARVQAPDRRPDPGRGGRPTLGARGALGPAGALGGRPGRRARGRPGRPDRDHPPGLVGRAQEGTAGRGADRARHPGHLPGRAAGRGPALRGGGAGRGRLDHRGVRPGRRHLRRGRGAQGRARVHADRPTGGRGAARRHRLRRGGLRARPGRAAGGLRRPGRDRPGRAVRGGRDPARVHRGQGGAEQRHRGVHPGADAGSPRGRCGCTAASSRP